MCVKIGTLFIASCSVTKTQNKLFKVLSIVLHQNMDPVILPECFERGSCPSGGTVVRVVPNATQRNLESHIEVVALYCTPSTKNS
jgi:hypothetical protein